MASPDLDQVLSSCSYYPVQVDLGRRMVWFAEIDREVYRRAGFLVPKHARMSEERYGFNLDDVLLRDLSLPIGGAPSHYIFISAFCCSTLLARLLDEVPGCLVLKEPSILGQLAMLRYRPRRGQKDGKTEPSPVSLCETPSPGGRGLTSEVWEEDWQTWSALGVRLLTRTFEPGQTVIVKAADTCNTMCDAILGHDPRSKAVLLSVGLRTFILSVLKLENRRDWTRKRAIFWHKTLALFPVLNEVNVPELDDARKAAYVWLVTAALWDRFRKQVAQRGRGATNEDCHSERAQRAKNPCIASESAKYGDSSLTLRMTGPKNLAKETRFRGLAMQTSASEVCGPSLGLGGKAADLKDGGLRYLVMDGEEVSENPGVALRKVAGFFGLPLEQSRVEEILADPVLTHHAKFPGKTYDAAMRRNDLADWEARFGAEAGEAMEWAESVEEALESEGVDLGLMASDAVAPVSSPATLAAMGACLP